MILFGKKKKVEEKTSLEERKFKEAVRKEKRDREVVKKEVKRENWHKTSHIANQDQDKKVNGDKITKMIRREEDCGKRKMENPYEKVARMLKNEKKRQRIKMRKRF